MPAKRKRKPTKADLYLAQPEVREYLAKMREAQRSDDIRILTRLVKRLDGRKARHVAPRLRRPGLTFRRDPVFVVARYLRRFSGGEWHRGGHHVARLNHGPGIAIPDYRNRPLKPYLINTA